MTEKTQCILKQSADRMQLYDSFPACIRKAIREACNGTDENQIAQSLNEGYPAEKIAEAIKHFGGVSI